MDKEQELRENLGKARKEFNEHMETKQNEIYVDYIHSGINLNLIYNKNGILQYVKNFDTDEYLIIHSSYSGSGFNVEQGLIDIDDVSIKDINNVCNADYVRIVDLNVFIPRLLFIKNIE